jgi:hypothetical protein
VIGNNIAAEGSIDTLLSSLISSKLITSMLGGHIPDKATLRVRTNALVEGLESVPQWRGRAAYNAEELAAYYGELLFSGLPKEPAAPATPQIKTTVFVIDDGGYDE